MENNPSFETPANRRSPANFPSNKMQQRAEKDYGLVSNAFEALKPYVSGALDNQGTWLDDEICLDAHKNLDLVMPPIGYEANLRKFRHFKEVTNKDIIDSNGNGNGNNNNGFIRVASQHDIYEEETPIDQGTISNCIDSEVEMEENLNEFGFGYRNGFVYNEKNKHSKDSLLYITHKHATQTDLNKHLHYIDNNDNGDYNYNINNYNSPKKRFSGVNGNNNNNNNNNNNKSSYSAQRSSYRSPHVYDRVEDVTTTTTGNKNKKANTAGNDNVRVRTRGRTFGTEEEDDDTEMGEFSFNNGSFGRGLNSGSNRKVSFSNNNMEIQDEEDSKGEPIAWMDKFDIFRSDRNSNNFVDNPRRESFVSEYSNYTPDGPPRQQRQNIVTSKKKLIYTNE